MRRLQVLAGTGKVLISGGIGTGKTMLARRVGGDVYVNCYMNKTEHRVLEEIIRQIKPRYNPAGLPNQKLWGEIESGTLVILDEIDGMNVDELRHLAYVISRQYEIGKKIDYIAITRNHFILEQLINDDAIWSTFAGKSVVELKPYTAEQLRTIIDARAQESLDGRAYDDELVALIADIALNAPGHMRTAIDLLRNAALVAENRGATEIAPDDVREANREEWLADLDSMEADELLVFLSVAQACKGRAYTSTAHISETLAIKQEEFDLRLDPRRVEKLLQTLLNQDFIYAGEFGYTVLNYPLGALTDELQEKLQHARQRA
jgi:cell division control protein 6